MKKLEVVAAIIYFEDEILCVQRPENKYSYISKKFEFPGGKIKEGETRKEALSRELVEELNITPVVDDLYLTVVYEYPDFELTMHSFKCFINTKNIKLNEHISNIWLRQEELVQLDWARADVPIVEKLMNDE